MEFLPRNTTIESSLLSCADIANVTLKDLVDNFHHLNLKFHSFFEQPHRDVFIKDAQYHKDRYLDLFSRSFSGKVLDVGNDKPFLSFFLRRLKADAEFKVISFYVPESPSDLYAVDIEDEAFPFPDNEFEQVILTEVIEHLWRNPSRAIHEINRVLKPNGTLLLTTPNPCERHALVCILWQANPNQRSQYYSNLESGHLHLWTIKDLKTILEAHGFEIGTVKTADFYNYTKEDKVLNRFIRKVSPTPELMGEAIVIEATKIKHSAAPLYPFEIFPDGGPVQFSGALKSFALRYLARIK